MSDFLEPIISPAGSGRVAIAFGAHAVRISGEETGGALGVIEATLPPGGGPPMHLHEREDELFRVLSGRFGFWCGLDYVELEAGGLVALPRGVPHRFQNVGESDGTVMAIVTPGGFERFFLDIEAKAPAGPAEIGAIAAGFGLTFLPRQEKAA